MTDTRDSRESDGQGRRGSSTDRTDGPNHTHQCCPHHRSTSSRRAVLLSGAGLAVALAGCVGDDGTDGTDSDAPDPVTLTRADQCELCGMVIPNHPGPVAEVFYAEQRPSGHGNPARFCSTWEAFTYDFERRDRGWERTAFYVTDYSAVDYDLITDAGDTLISTHVAASAFAGATEVTFVVGSEVKGAMGRDLIGFSGQDDAAAFRREHGGELGTFEEITEATIGQLANR
ncbi:nitrous oxide reductase accessory protein NosL [Halorientalis pallida]|uniref:Nitrous oxide reductase accessory protein NosL n=1 Tax=Halorientalis pallida TaxID=2479928 RepID=A0A498KWE7_9EURY|nr:nitrous oxide reductase accessory protein NosL [Halorientalis pallida]RXK49226.1 nitrous oxide reductase accessory protein NosL [Halorientalis pallida]